ncbi:unnamed protein product, partial [Iphiclides podalirius]
MEFTSTLQQDLTAPRQAKFAALISLNNGRTPTEPNTGDAFQKPRRIPTSTELDTRHCHAKYPEPLTEAVSRSLLRGARYRCACGVASERTGRAEGPTPRESSVRSWPPRGTVIVRAAELVEPAADHGPRPALATLTT